MSTETETATKVYSARFNKVKTFEQVFDLNESLIQKFQGLITENNHLQASLNTSSQKLVTLEAENAQLNANLTRERDLSIGLITWIKGNLNPDTFVQTDISSLCQNIHPNHHPELKQRIQSIASLAPDEEPQPVKDISAFLEALFTYSSQVDKRYEEVSSTNAELMQHTHVIPLDETLKRTWITLQAAMYYIWDHLSEVRLLRLHPANPQREADAREKLQQQFLSVTAGYMRAMHITDKLYPQHLFKDPPYDSDYHHDRVLQLEDGVTTLINTIMARGKEEMDADPDRIINIWKRKFWVGVLDYSDGVDKGIFCL